MEEKVDVLLATYNGEKYLKEQIDSILNQTYQNINLIISDDNSNDSTRKILEEYKKIDNRIKILKAASPSCVYYRRNRDGSAINSLRPRGQRLKNNFKLMTNYTKYYLQDIRHYNIFFYISRLVAEMISMTFAVRGKIQQ